MRQSLQQRIADGLDAQPKPRDEQAKLVEDFARILRETAAAAAASRPGGPADEPAGRQQFTLPQILQPKPVVVRENPRPVVQWLRALPRDMASAIVSAPLTTTLAIAGAIAIGLVWRGELTFLEPQARWAVAKQARAEPRAPAPLVAVQSVRTVTVETARERSSEASPAVLVAHAERLIGDGNVLAARELLGRAALTGDVAARFALAETFDPNVLASWGLRGVSADPGTARLLYEQVLVAGEIRAERRLKALRTD